MSTLLGKFHIADDAPIYLTPATVTATAATQVGSRRLIRIMSDQAVNLLVGNSGVSAPTATTGIRIAPNVAFEFETADQHTHVRLFNTSASTANISIAFLSRN